MDNAVGVGVSGSGVELGSVDDAVGVGVSGSGVEMGWDAGAGVGGAEGSSSGEPSEVFSCGNGGE